jgi:hypothetical protein
MIRIRLVVREDEALKTVARQLPDDLDDQSSHERNRKRDGSRPRGGQGAGAVRQRGGANRYKPCPREVDSEKARQLLRTYPIHDKRQVRAMLLNGAERQ